MRAFLLLFAGLFLPFAALAAQEGTPVYYQSGYRPAAASVTSGGNTIVGQRSYSYQVPRPAQIPDQSVPYGAAGSTMTPSGIGLPTQPSWLISAEYARKFANFDFETGVQSKLKWDDMIIDEIGVRIDHNFTVRNFDLFVFGEYRLGNVSDGYMSMDYDLKPFDNSNPSVGIFTISVGDLSGKTDYLRLGFGAKNVWDLAGWKISPSIGYEIFHHNLEMSNHIYPNPAIYLPMLNQWGDYIFGDEFGNFYAIPQGVPPPADLYQVCLSPEDIRLANSAGPGLPPAQGGGLLDTIPYDPSFGSQPWGVPSYDCVIIGGDGPIEVKGVTHIYNTTWNGLYLGLEFEKQMTFSDKLRFYFQVGMPNFYSEGIWPNRTDWQQNPSFIDEGSNSAYSYSAEMEYNYKISERLHLSLKADTSYFYVGQIGGKLFVAGYSYWLMDQDGQFILNDLGLPILETVEPHTVNIRDSLKYARWQSFGLHLGVKYAF